MWTAATRDNWTDGYLTNSIKQNYTPGCLLILLADVVHRFGAVLKNFSVWLQLSGYFYCPFAPEDYSLSNLIGNETCYESLQIRGIHDANMCDAYFRRLLVEDIWCDAKAVFKCHKV